MAAIARLTRTSAVLIRAPCCRDGEPAKPAAVKNKWWGVRIGAEFADFQQRDGVVAQGELGVQAAIQPRRGPVNEHRPLGQFRPAHPGEPVPDLA
ncbi:hypothetical protein MGAD_00160 [Mycolicibacterium gadium]|uniref:Uncharacterized protein n=1 Tax=Mycolicibacterium gadium TaxID=1794 RepID=A0A7I7WGP6_MYCGU|nr:hypothetical protein MGAD_00160 [Mycolicibacterium gadium]